MIIRALGIWVLSICCYGNPSVSVQTSVESFVNDINQPTQNTAHHISKIIDRHISPHLDYLGISQLVLGDHWKRSSVQQKKRFLACFPRQLHQRQIDLITAWKPTTWQLSQETFNQNQTKLALGIRLLKENQSRLITLRLHKVNQEWLIYDTAYENLSLLKTFKDDYSEKIARMGLKRTLAKLCQDYPELIKDLTLAGLNWPPFVARGLPGQGMSVELVTSVLELAGYQVKLVIAPWKRVMEGIRLGDYDINLAIWKSKQRSQHLAFSQAYFRNEIVVISPHLRFLTASNLSALFSFKGTLGLMDDYAYGSTISRYPNRKYFTQYPPLFRALESHSLDFALLDKTVAKYYLTQHVESGVNLQVSTYTLETKPLHIAMLKAHPVAKEVLADFNLYLKKYLKSPAYRALLSRYKFAKPAS